MTKTQRLINRIKEVENFENMAYVCEDFATFIDELRVGSRPRGGVDFDDEVNVGMMNAFFASFGCTPSNPHRLGGTHNELLQNELILESIFEEVQECFPYLSEKTN